MASSSHATRHRKLAEEYLIFLNNDTQFNRIQALCLNLSNESKVGAVAPSLFILTTPCRKGGIIWQDATGCNYGKGKDHTEPHLISFGR